MASISSPLSQNALANMIFERQFLEENCELLYIYNAENLIYIFNTIQNCRSRWLRSVLAPYQLEMEEEAARKHDPIIILKTIK